MLFHKPNHILGHDILHRDNLYPLDEIGSGYQYLFVPPTGEWVDLTNHVHAPASECP
jgi:hypothetical protein